MTRANILKRRQCCEFDCPTTIRLQPYGDVRRCEHGQIWMYLPGWSGFHWVRLSPMLNPLKYRRAVRALAKEVTDV
ncbi:hypothetical protein [Nocardia sp. NPDC004711]